MRENMLNEDDFKFAQTTLLTLARQMLLIPIPELLKSIEEAKSHSTPFQPLELSEKLENLEDIVNICNDFRNSLINLDITIDYTRFSMAPSAS